MQNMKTQFWILEFIKIMHFALLREEQLRFLFCLSCYRLILFQNQGRNEEKNWEQKFN